MTAPSDSRADARSLRAAINTDGLLDLFGGATLVLTAGANLLGWLLTGNPGVFAALILLLPAFLFEPARKRLTYRRLGCPDYAPVQETRFALVAMSVLAVLGVVVFVLTMLAGIRVLRPLFVHAPAWAALAGSALLVLLAWWYRAPRFLIYVAVAAAAVVAGYRLSPHMPVRLVTLAGAVGAAMVLVGLFALLRFLKAHPAV